MFRFYFKKNTFSKKFLPSRFFNSSEYRVERDTFGPINVKADRYWGAQTQRSLQNFAIGTSEDKMPMSVIKAMAIVKKSAAKVNMRYGLKEDIGNGIINAANEVLEGKIDSHFPLVIFQTGSGTQTNMNVNEVISNRASTFINKKVHPNDDVNRSQSSNDTFPTAMHVAVNLEFHKLLLPTLQSLESNLLRKSKEFESLIKIGRTHLQDATPLTLGQEISGYYTQVHNHINHLNENVKYIQQLAQGGTAVGTGLNTRKGFDEAIAQEITSETGIPFVTAPNKFEALATHDALTHFSGTLNSLATSLYKIAHDIKILSRELTELSVPDVNPCDELLMSCIQVIGNHNAVSAGSK